MKSVFLSLGLLASLFAYACGNKPSYGGADPNANRPRAQSEPPAEGTTNNNSTPQQPTQPSEPTVATPPSGEQRTAQTSQPPFKAPWFLDTVKGEPKDLRNYPNARRMSFSYGPIAGSDTVSLVLSTRDSMDKITAFYEKEIKLNKWTVEDKTLDPEFSEWLLKKGEDEQAKLQVKKQQGKSDFIIVVARAGKIQAGAAQSND
ncbi:MAG TPA: hypothetical protein VKM94_25210 [Blastocatellia bacterium]|nr:hypothetical protein [Blastocatellia bacterium]